jgi:deoxyribonuclease-4
MRLYGYHINDEISSIFKEIDLAKERKCNLVQLFVTPNKFRNVYKKVKSYLEERNMYCVVHASYTINLAQNWDNYSWWIIKFLDEIYLANEMKAFGIVIHMGKQKELTFPEAINNMYTSLLHIYNKIKDLNIKIFIETPAGQGTELCYDINDYLSFCSKFMTNKKFNDKFRMCLDTCHIYSAGYDIKKSEKTKELFYLIENRIGLRYVGLVHLNDSKTPFNSNIDRHEQLGKGTIGKESLLIFSSFAKKENIPIILESRSGNHINEINNYLL